MSETAIQVAIRCRPFTIEDDLGVKLTTTADGKGEIEVIDTKYVQTRFPFSYSWWSAYDYDSKCKKNVEIAKEMELVSQEDVYNRCGMNIKKQVLDGSAVVLFAYGLSGSGKTFTVFGPDDPKMPDAWYKHSKPHKSWGIFPRLAYDIFQLKQNGWSIKMKYFQNVVDVVRDLMAPDCKEQSYKNGLKKDNDGFVDVEWCVQKPIKSWDDLRAVFKDANSRKAISPTQFNPQSTRGHCVLILEVEQPNPEYLKRLLNFDTVGISSKIKGRIYVCDLAGTEPAADIVYAKYEMKTNSNGVLEQVYKGPHDNPKKTKELQDQGKKINLSLTEMSQFFMKMADAFKKKELKPGVSIPGCNSYFLCKFLKQTLCQAQTYLFSAIRPEHSYHQYTYATLGFSLNASVIKLAPKKATAGKVSKVEEGYLKQLDELNGQLVALHEDLKRLNKTGGDKTKNMQTTVKVTKQKEEVEDKLNKLLNGDYNDYEENVIDKQNKEYLARGIHLSSLEPNVSVPYLCNLEEDPFRSKRYIYKFEKALTVIGIGNDIQPFAINVGPNFCTFEKESNPDGSVTVYIKSGSGNPILNGAVVKSNERLALNMWDRVAIGTDLMIYCDAGNINLQLSDIDVDGAFQELNETLKALDKAKASSDPAVARRMREFESLNHQYTSKHKVDENTIADMDILRTEMAELGPKLNEAEALCIAMGRDIKLFPSIYENLTTKGIKLKVEVKNGLSEERIQIEVFEFDKAFSWIKDEFKNLKVAIDNRSEYIVSKERDPLTIFFDYFYHLGDATFNMSKLSYTNILDGSEGNLSITNSVPPYNNVGTVEVAWIPVMGGTDTAFGSLSGGFEALNADTLLNILESFEDEAAPGLNLGKTWTFELQIKSAFDLPVPADSAFISYNFFGEMCITESVEQNNNNPVWNYSRIHHVEKVTQEFIDWLKEPFIFRVNINPYISTFPTDIISSSNPDIISRLSGDGSSTKAQGKKLTGLILEMKMKEKIVVHLKYDRMVKQCELKDKEIESLKEQLNTANEEIKALKAASGGSVIKSPKGAVVETKSNPKSPVNKINNAKAIDGKINK